MFCVCLQTYEHHTSAGFYPQRPYRLEMELQVTVRYHVGSRNQTLSPAKGQFSPRCLCTRIQEFTQPLHHGASERKVTDALMLAATMGI